MDARPPNNKRQVVVVATGMVGRFARRYAVGHPGMAFVKLLVQNAWNLSLRAERSSALGF